MKAAARRQMLTSARLSGGARAQQPRKRATAGPQSSAVVAAAAVIPEPAYSLYSTESEDQVTTLHKGLDRCAALLTDILHADSAEVSPGAPMKAGASSHRSLTSMGKKTSKKERKTPTKTEQRSFPAVRPGLRTPRPHAHTPAHSGVKLHPSKKRPHAFLPPHTPTSQHQAQQLTTSCPPVLSLPHASIPLSALQSVSQQPPDCRAASEAPPTLGKVEGSRRSEHRSVTFDRHEPDTDGQNAASAAAADPRTHDADPHTRACSAKAEPGRPDGARHDVERLEDPERAANLRNSTVESLLGELKSLIAGQGSVAERLLRSLEQEVLSSLINTSNTEIQPDLQTLHIQNTQLRRRVKILNQQLKERENTERKRNLEALCNSQVWSLQEEVSSAQTQLQEVQHDLIELRQALQDTQRQLRDSEVENAILRTDLESVRVKLLHIDKEKKELAALAQQRMKEIENLHRIIQSRVSEQQQQRGGGVVDPASERISQYLMSLNQLERTHVNRAARVSAEREARSPQKKSPRSVPPRDASSRPDGRSQSGDRAPATAAQMHAVSSGEGPCRRRLFSSSVSQTDTESFDWSLNSGSTFDTRDEAAFRDGLAALDASIASLQKTIKLDLGR